MLSFFSLLWLIASLLYLTVMYESTAMLLLAYLVAAFFVVSFFALLYRKMRIHMTLEVPVGISDPGKENLVQIKVENRSLGGVARMEAYVTVKDVIRRKKTKFVMKISDVPRGESCMIRNVMFQKPGNYVVKLKKVRVYDRTGLLYMTIRPGTMRQVHVASPYYDVPVRLTMATKNFYGETDVYDEKLPGYDNSETFQVRAYQKGDRLQNVHWKLTAKQDELMVKENAMPNGCPVVLFLDFYESRWRQRPRATLAFLEAASSLSFSMMDAGCPHYVVWYDKTQKDIVRIRVDDEETLFHFISMLMRIEWEKMQEDMKLRYAEKYSREPYVCGISLNRKLVLRKDGEILSKLSARKLEKSLAHTELLL